MQGKGNPKRQTEEQKLDERIKAKWRKLNRILNELADYFESHPEKENI